MRTCPRPALATAAIFFASALGAMPASANGRFPRSEILIEHPSSPSKISVVATYGLLVTDDLKDWRHVCEAAFAFQNMYAGDPLAALLPDESLLVGTDAILAVSHDHGCDFTKVLELPRGNFVDLAVAPSKPTTIVALVTDLSGATPTLHIQESTDAAVTWKEIGTALPLATGYTVDVDPKDPNHLFVTGLKDASDRVGPGLLLTSTDHAMTWNSSTIPNTNALAAPYIAKIHPTDPDKIFVRVDSWKNTDVIETADDSLLYSSDGGKTWVELLHPGGPDPESPGAKLFGFALSPDGATVLAGYGDPVDGSRLVERGWTGIYKSSSDGKYTFGGTPAMPDPPLVDDLVSCLTWTSHGVYACFSLDGRPQYVAYAQDANISASSLTKILNVPDTKGKPSCCNGRAVSTCDWNVDCMNLGACVDGGGNVSGGTSATCSPDGGATAGGAGGAMSSGAGGATATGASTGTAGTSGSSEASGCGCRLSSRGGGRVLSALWVFVALAARRRRLGGLRGGRALPFLRAARREP